MPKSDPSWEARMEQAIEAYRQAKKPNLAKTAREYGINADTLRRRIKRGHRP